MDRLFYKLITESVNENRVAYFQVMTWVYSTYNSEIGPIRFLENLLNMLQTWSNKDVIGNMLYFLLESFSYFDNIAVFLELNGAVILTKLLCLVHSPAGNNAKRFHPHQIGNLCFKMLLKLIEVQHNCVDENGNVRM
jgi:hypothetical protein